MPTLASAHRAVEAARLNRQRIPIAFDGSGLSVDYPSVMAEQDLVYLRAPHRASEAMPIGDGDLGAALWTPGCLRLQVQKSDLWRSATAERSGEPEATTQVAAGTLSLFTDPALFKGSAHYEQRLSLYNGTIHIESDADPGACQITAFASATTGIIVIHYADQMLRNGQRQIEVSLGRRAHPFALGHNIGLLQALPDRRYAMMARIEGKQAEASLTGRGSATLTVEPCRSSRFTLYLSVATSPVDGDPVRLARARLDTAMRKGYDRLLREQRQHWSHFWQKSVVRLHGPEDAPEAAFATNLWHLALYQLACCSRGYDPPLADGGLFRSLGDRREVSGIYQSAELRSILDGLIATNHLELSVPIVDSFYRMLPQMAARTESGMAGARFPEAFNYSGAEVSPPVFAAPAPPETPEEPLARDLPARFESGGIADPSGAEGLLTALLVWDAWRCAPDIFFLKERAYPLLRAASTYALDLARLRPPAMLPSDERALLRRALRALRWASREIDADEEHRADWELGERSLGEPTAMEIWNDAGGPLWHVDLAERLRALRPGPQGYMRGLAGVPDIAAAGAFCAEVSGMLLREEPLDVDAIAESVGGVHSGAGFAGAPLAALRVFPELPPGWSGSFSLIAPGGFRVSAEALEGRTRYAAIKSLLGGVCRIFNPWGPGIRIRVHDGHQVLHQTSASVIEIATRSGEAFLIEQGDNPIVRSVRLRMAGKRNLAPRAAGPYQLGLPPTPGLSPAVRPFRAPEAGEISDRLLRAGFQP